MPGVAHRRRNQVIRQLTTAEQHLIENVLRQHGRAADAFRCVNLQRDKANIRRVEKSAVYRFAKGRTHRRGAIESRGRKRSLAGKEIRRLDQARRRLIKRADNEVRVTHADIIEEAGLKHAACQRVCEDALRAQGVSYRHPRRKIQLTDQDAKQRMAIAKVWLKRQSSYWSKRVHAFVDNKAFPIPLTPDQRKRFRQTMITGHLRKPSEGVHRGFTKPREKHSFIGLPSVTISAAVAKDKVIMWHVVPGSWNGAAAATMYEEHLKPALQSTWGKRARYTIVEDGDRKGNTSGKGIAAKARAKIFPLTLPPRTPSLMPLDYAIWSAIVKQMLVNAPKGTEKKDAFLERLRDVARKLPKGYVKSVIGRMRGNLRALVDAAGYTPKND